jgi:hypothetical protein
MMKPMIAGMLLGILVLGGARFALAPLSHATHHHANWAVMIDGERLDLSGDPYMEEVAACRASDDGILPEQRIHMHENDHDVVHVHHEGATWGALAANLGMSLGDEHLILADGTGILASDSARFVFVLNGFQVPSVHNRVVQSGDRLLISVTDAPGSVLESEFPLVASNALEYNERMDPASCAGHGELGFLERLRLAFWG